MTPDRRCQKDAGTRLSRRRMALLSIAVPAASFGWSVPSALSQAGDAFGTVRELGARLREQWQAASFGTLLRTPASLEATMEPMRRAAADAAAVIGGTRSTRAEPAPATALDAPAAQGRLMGSGRVARLEGMVTLGPDDTILVPKHLDMLDLRGVVLTKVGGDDPILDIRHDCQIVGGTFDHRAAPMTSYLSGPTIRFTKASSGGVSGASFAVSEGPAVLARDCANLVIAFNRITNRNEVRRTDHSEIPAPCCSKARAPATLSSATPSPGPAGWA